MRRVFTGLTAALMLAVLVQFFLAGSGAFNPAPTDEAFAPHRALGYLILLFAVLLTIVGALARVPGRLIGMTGLVAGLAVLQPVIAVVAGALGESGVLVFGLHAVNGLAIAGIATSSARRAVVPKQTAASV